MKSDVNYYMILFVYSLLVGVLTGAIYDVFRIIRIILPKAKAIIFIEDILFCLTASLVMIIFIFNAGFGIVRGFIIIGALLGFTAYYFTVGKIVYKLSDLIIRLIKKLIKFLCRIVTTPIIFLYKQIIRISGILIRYIRFRYSLSSALKKAKSGFYLYQTGK